MHPRWFWVFLNAFIALANVGLTRALWNQRNPVSLFTAWAVGVSSWCIAYNLLPNG